MLTPVEPVSYTHLAYRALRRQFLLLDQDLPQQPSIDPLQNHIHLAAVFVGEHFHHRGMVQFRADLFLAPKALVKSGIAFHFGVGNLDGYVAIVAQIGAAKNRSHPAASNELVDAVMVQCVAGM